MKKLNFGSGEKIMPGYDNADLDNHNGANITFDFNKFPYKIKENTYDYILASHVLEHLKEPEKTIWELAKISKSGGVIEIHVPHMNCEAAFCLGHLNFWNYVSFVHLAVPSEWMAKRKIQLKILKLKVIPSRFGRLIPTNWLRRKMSLLVRGIYTEIRCKFQVIKQK